MRNIKKAYKTDAGPFLALKGIDLQVDKGEFVAVVGKSGSGKSTLINMFTGIDHPTEGEVVVAQTPIRQLDEGQMAEWRGRMNLGIVFQFFQLLPTLTVVENVMIPMDLAGKYDEAQRLERALYLLDQVGIAEMLTSSPPPYPAASSSARPSPAPWPMIRRSLSPTSRRATWTRARPNPSSSYSRPCRRGQNRFSWSRMTVNWPAACRARSPWPMA